MGFDCPTVTDTGPFRDKREAGKGYTLLERKIYRRAQRMNTGAGKPGLEQMRPQPTMKVLVIEATT